MTEIGTPPPSGGGIDKRTLLIGAVLLGGAIGAFVLFSRKSQPSDTAENKAQTNTASDLAYQNIATQLLGFRGDVSVANATLAQQQDELSSAVASGNTTSQQGQQGIYDTLMSIFGSLGAGQQNILSAVDTGQRDILTSVGNETASRAASDDHLNSALAAWFSQVFAGNATNKAAIDGAFSSLSTQTNDVFNALAQGQANLGTQSNAQYDALAQGQAALANQSNDQFNASRGAGGATARDSILAAIGSEDDSHYYLAHMSSGPVRQISNRRY